MHPSVIYQALLPEINQIPVIDTHEHLDLWDSRIQRGDLLDEYLLHYMDKDLRSAGLSAAQLAYSRDRSVDLLTRWHTLEPFWEACRYTGYGRSLDIAVRHIYGVDGIRTETLLPLYEKYRASLVQGHTETVLTEHCKIKKVLLDVSRAITEPAPPENPLYYPVWQPSAYIRPTMQTCADITADAVSAYGVHIRTLDDWVALMLQKTDDKLSLYQSHILKCALAYQRPLRFEETAYHTAADLFRTVYARWENAGRPVHDQSLFPQALQDYCMHALLRHISGRGITVQFHTGLLESNGNTIRNSDPTHLDNLFLSYPDIGFDLFHIGYPFQNLVASLVKNFPHVTVDFCWAHMISPYAAQSALSDYLDAVPYTKISAFGGDYKFPDGVYGHLTLARENVARVLSDKIAQGVFGESTALTIAHALFFDNPNRIFSLGL